MKSTRTLTLALMLFIALTACDHAPPDSKATSTRTIGEIDAAVTRLEEKNDHLETSIRSLEQSQEKWVLWESDSLANGPIVGIKPAPDRPIDAFANKEQCIVHAQAMVQAKASDKQTEWAYTCLPETVDPRLPAR